MNSDCAGPAQPLFTPPFTPNNSATLCTAQGSTNRCTDPRSAAAVWGGNTTGVTVTVSFFSIWTDSLPFTVDSIPLDTGIYTAEVVNNAVDGLLSIFSSALVAAAISVPSSLPYEAAMYLFSPSRLFVTALVSEGAATSRRLLRLDEGRGLAAVTPTPMSTLHTVPGFVTMVLSVAVPAEDIGYSTTVYAVCNSAALSYQMNLFLVSQGNYPLNATSVQAPVPARAAAVQRMPAQLFPVNPNPVVPWKPNPQVAWVLLILLIFPFAFAWTRWFGSFCGWPCVQLSTLCGCWPLAPDVAAAQRAAILLAPECLGGERPPNGKRVMTKAPPAPSRDTGAAKPSVVTNPLATAAAPAAAPVAAAAAAAPVVVVVAAPVEAPATLSKPPPRTRTPASAVSGLSAFPPTPAPVVRKSVETALLPRLPVVSVEAPKQSAHSAARAAAASPDLPLKSELWNEDEDVAAVKIAAAYKGYKVRRTLAEWVKVVDADGDTFYKHVPTDTLDWELPPPPFSPSRTMPAGVPYEIDPEGKRHPLADGWFRFSDAKDTWYGSERGETSWTPVYPPVQKRGGGGVGAV